MRFSFPHFQEFSSPCLGSVHHVSFGLCDGGGLYLPLGGFSLVFTLSYTLVLSEELLTEKKKKKKRACHFSGDENLVTDFLSRGKFLPSEWMLV